MKKLSKNKLVIWGITIFSIFNLALIFAKPTDAEATTRCTQAQCTTKANGGACEKAEVCKYHTGSGGRCTGGVQAGDKKNGATWSKVCELLNGKNSKDYQCFSDDKNWKTLEDQNTCIGKAESYAQALIAAEAAEKEKAEEEKGSDDKKDDKKESGSGSSKDKDSGSSSGGGKGSGGSTSTDCSGISDAAERANCYAGVASGGSTTELMPTLQQIMNVVLGFIGFIAVAMIVVGGILYVTSSGEAGKTKKAKDTIMYGIIGLIIALLAAAIVNFVIGNIFA